MARLIKRLKNERDRVGSALMGLALLALFGQLAEKAMLPFRWIICVAEEELLRVLPIGWICEVAVSCWLKGDAILASRPWMAVLGSAIHMVTRSLLP
jgi:hypothetical protein